MRSFERHIIYGGGGHGRVVLDGALCLGLQIDWILDDNPCATELNRIPLIHAQSFALKNVKDLGFIIGIGDNSRRFLIFQRMSSFGNPFNVVHPFSSISQNATLGQGVAAMRGVLINCGALIGDNVILNTGCSIDHDCVIEPHSHIGPGVHLAGNVRVGAGSFIGIGTSITPGISIGKNCVIGAGSAVVRDIPDNSVAFGVPARVVRKNEVPFLE